MVVFTISKQWTTEVCLRKLRARFPSQIIFFLLLLFSFVALEDLGLIQRAHGILCKESLCVSFGDFISLWSFIASPYSWSVSRHESKFQKTPREEISHQEVTCQQTQWELTGPSFPSVCSVPGTTPLISPNPAFRLPTAWLPVPIYLQIIWNEDFASFLNHGLWLQFFLRELAFARVKHFLPWDAGESKICWVWFIPDRNLDGVRVNGTRCISVCWQQLAWKNTEVFIYIDSKSTQDTAT